MRAALIIAALWAAGAAAQDVYKYTDAKGNTVYTDRPPPEGAADVERIEMPAQPTVPSGLSEGEKALAADAERRLAELDRATADISVAFKELRAAEARRDQGVEPIEGERQGRRFRPEYWARQQQLANDVAAARARLDDAVARRNAVR